MNVRQSLISMLKQLLVDMQQIQQQGAGYYSCAPIARRYNKLLGQARPLFRAIPGLMDTFDEIDESDPKNPSDKMKVMQGIQIEIGQLISLLASADDGGPAT